MATYSGTYNFLPSLGEVVINSYARIKVPRTAFTPQHMLDARMEANFLLSEWSNRQVNLWTVELITETLVEGQATYDVDPQIVMILDAYIRTNAGTSQPFDRVIYPISRTEYSSLPDKTVQATPTTFWFDRLIEPTITLWQVPDQNGPYELRYYACRQVQDANLSNNQNIEIPYRWIDAFCAGLAHRLARIHSTPDIEQMRKMDAKEAWDIAATQDTENVPFFIVPGIRSYYNR